MQLCTQILKTRVSKPRHLLFLKKVNQFTGDSASRTLKSWVGLRGVRRVQGRVHPSKHLLKTRVKTHALSTVCTHNDIYVLTTMCKNTEVYEIYIYIYICSHSDIPTCADMTLMCFFSPCEPTICLKLQPGWSARPAGEAPGTWKEPISDGFWQHPMDCDPRKAGRQTTGWESDALQSSRQPR